MDAWLYSLIYGTLSIMGAEIFDVKIMSGMSLINDHILDRFFSKKFIKYFIIGWSITILIQVTK